MTIHFLTISKDDLLFAFNHYNEFINKGYEKIPYSEWQTLRYVLQSPKYKEFHFYFNKITFIVIMFKYILQLLLHIMLIEGFRQFITHISTKVHKYIV